MGYLHTGAIFHGLLVALPVTVAGIFGLVDYRQARKRRTWHYAMIILPILALILTPVYMFQRMGIEEWLTEGRLPVLIIYEGFSIAQLWIAVILTRGIQYREGRL
jgi:cell division protein FtsW (lipid II flippase)